jgi:hypothetical protein
MRPISTARRSHLSAAPPDEAGHQGAFTRPGDLLSPCESSSEQPPLNSDTTHGRPIDRSPGVALLIATGVAVTAILLFGVYLPF